MEEDLCHKTVFVLDHCRVMREQTGSLIEIDVGNRVSVPVFQFYPPITKTLWNCVAESTMEYARIVWDVFGEERLIRIITSNPQKPIHLNDWSKTQQNMTFVMEAFAAAGPPLNAAGSINIGIISAIKALSEPTPRQLKKMNEASNGGSTKIPNKGRIVCITSCTSDFDVDSIIASNLAKNNTAAQAAERKLPIDELEFLLISFHPKGKELSAKVLSTPMKRVFPQILKYGCRVLGPDNFHESIQQTCVEHHDLVVTTVTGIPMKEEAAASTSVNYDVNLYHPRLSPSNEAQVLKWAGPSPPKSAVSHLCHVVFRTTPVDVISRPTTCLCNFVLSGRSVWLESQKKVVVPAKATCNVLQSHGGEIWIHVMETSRNVLEDPPSISEGSGGRVTDYRIPDFVEFMKQNLLVPCGNPETSGVDKLRRMSIEQDSKGRPLKPYEESKKRLFQKTSYWPLTYGASILFGLSTHLDSLLKIFPGDSLDELQKIECEKCFWALMAIEARGDPPPLTGYQLKKGCKKDEQWRMVYAEIETFLRSHQHSEVHRNVLACFTESRKREDKAVDESTKPENQRGKRINNGSGSDPTFPQSVEKRQRKDYGSESRTNLFALWKLKTEKKNVRMIQEGAKLYAQVKESAAQEAPNPKSVKQ